MPNIKRSTNLGDYSSVLPYASEIFGVYQPLIGWKSKRQLQRIKDGLETQRAGLLSRLGRYLAPRTQIEFNADCAVAAEDLRPGDFARPRIVAQQSIVLREIAARLRAAEGVPGRDEWRALLEPDALTAILTDKVLKHYNEESIAACRRAFAREQNARTRAELLREIKERIDEEAVIAGTILKLAENGRAAELNGLFFTGPEADPETAFFGMLAQEDVDFKDPYLTFDPKKDVKDVSLSPLGIVHLFRQYFFELDTFLGTPTAHVWLSPGSTVELIEVSTRKTITEKTVEQTFESVMKSERSTTDEDEISEAVKEENRDDLKLGITSTVEQSWGTGSASATASLNMDRTQQVAREHSHKKMRQQTEKLSSEIRQNYKSTFKTVTEATETASKRYVLANPPDHSLLNYELRRKMRQVAVQVQDIGSYLCWQTFVDEPGSHLGLANLVHIAEPADLLPIPDQTQIAYLPDQVLTFKGNAVWDYGDDRQHGFVPVGVLDPPPAPQGLELVREPGVIPVTQISGSGEDFTGAWAFGARFTPAGTLEIGVLTGSGGLEWDERVDFVVGGALRYAMSATKKTEIDTANAAKKSAAAEASLANDRKTKETFIKAVKERVELASSLTKRKFEELREEERIIVYRNLIESLMSASHYKYADARTRHVLSELINSIFDIDKMLYFVAPEWWKPRDRAKQFLSLNDLDSKLSDSIVAWSDNRPRPDNYLVTDKSQAAALGSSLGWLLQLDGDNLRNAFLNAPWVKAVIPVRPGKEEAAINWLQNVSVEGADGLEDNYAAPPAELTEIRTGLGLPAAATVTIKDAIRYLCATVAKKHSESNEVKSYPKTEINDDNKVSATPIEKVYEHGFYPLQGGFRVSPNDPDPDPNNEDKNFQVFDQWIEILPTDQVVPVEVTYDPKTGRQV